MFKPTYLDAVATLVDDKLNGGNVDGPMSEIVLHEGVTPPTEEAIQTKLTSIISVWDAQEYARTRASAYDSVGDQLDQLMKDMRDGTTTHQTACEAVKAKYPKPS
jgi:hypothetical protein